MKRPVVGKRGTSHRTVNIVEEMTRAQYNDFVSEYSWNFRLAEMDNGEPCAPATIEPLSTVRDAVEEPPGDTSLIGLQQPINHGVWDNITYNTNTENAFMDMNDDILTLSIPPMDYGQTTNENFADILLSQLDDRD
ncbi:unnamed protein product, partial [Litomosoides sigmodontis]